MEIIHGRYYMIKEQGGKSYPVRVFVGQRKIAAIHYDKSWQAKIIEVPLSSTDVFSELPFSIEINKEMEVSAKQYAALYRNLLGLMAFREDTKNKRYYVQAWHAKTATQAINILLEN